MGDPIVHKPSPASPSFDRGRNQLRGATQPVVEHLEGRRMLYAGQLDAAFGTGGITKAPLGATKQFNDTVVLGDGRILAAGTGAGGSSGIDFTVARFTASGALDGTFGGGDGIVHTDFFGRDDVAKTVALVAGGKFIVGGTVGTVDGPLIVVARYNADGTLDTTFGTAGRASVRISGSDAFADLAVQSDGKVVVLGDTAGTAQTKRDLALVRFNADGSPDTTFGGGDGVATSDPSGSRFHVSRDDAARGLAIQSTGRIVVLAVGDGFTGTASGYTSDGTLDATFGIGGVHWEALPTSWDVDGDVVLAPDDSLLFSYTTGHYYRPFLGTRRIAADGSSLGGPFPPLPNYPQWPTWTREDGPVNFDADYVKALDVVWLPDGTYLQCGTIDGRFFVVRYLANGYYDSGFGAGGIAAVDLGGSTDMPDAARAMTMTADGKILLAGTFADGHQAAIVQLHADDFAGGAAAPRPWPFFFYDDQVTTNTDGVMRITGTAGDDRIWIEPYSNTSFAVHAFEGEGFENGSTSTMTLEGVAGVPVTRIVINGMGGNDRIWIAGGWGDLPVEIWGGAGNDTIIGGPRNDTIFGNLGKDHLEGGGGNDLLHGNGGHDRVIGNLGADRIFGDAGLDLLESGPGADRLFGGIDGDTIAGGAGPDTMYGEHGADTMTGGGGVDRAFNVAPMDTVLNVPIVSATTVSPPTSASTLLLQARVASVFRTLEGDEATSELL